MSYVCFNVREGNILAITNNKPDDLDFDCEWKSIIVDVAEVEDILLGNEDYANFIVIYDRTYLGYKLKRKEIIPVDELNIQEIVYKIPQVHKDLDADIKIIQDIDTTCWKVYVGKDAAGKLRAEFASLKLVLHFSVTQYNNPNILYRILKVDLEKLVNEHHCVLHFEEDWEYDPYFPVSIFTVRRFDNYTYQRVVDYGESI